MNATAGQKKYRRKMGAGDWINAVALFVIGLFLGIAANGLIRVAATDFWPSAVFTVFVFAALFAIFLSVEKLIDRFFPNRILPAKKGGRTVARPIGLLLSMPIGAVIGFVLGSLDLAKPLLDMLP